MNVLQLLNPPVHYLAYPNDCFYNEIPSQEDITANPTTTKVCHDIGTSLLCNIFTASINLLLVLRIDTGGWSVRCSAFFNEVPIGYPLMNYLTIYIIKYPLNQYNSLQNKPNDGYTNIPKTRKHAFFTHIFEHGNLTYFQTFMLENSNTYC